MVSEKGTRFRLVDHFHRRHDFEGVPLRLWVLCLLVGCLSVMIAIAVDLVAKGIYDGRVALCEASDAPDGGSGSQLKWSYWLGTSALLSLSAALLLKWVPAAAGSGLPEVKMLLSGIVLFDSFSLKALLVKPLSLSLALASSLSIGRRGIYTLCVLPRLPARQRAFMNFHHDIREQRAEGLLPHARGCRLHFWSTGCGVLFSAEITSTGLYNVEHLPRAFFCVTLALAFVHIFLRPLLQHTNQPNPLALFTTSFESSHQWSPLEIFAFALQGAFSAISAACVLRFVNLAARLRPYLAELGRFILPPLVAMLCSGVNLALSGGACRGLFTEGGGGSLDRLFNYPQKGATAAESAAAADAATRHLCSSYSYSPY